MIIRWVLDRDFGEVIVLNQKMSWKGHFENQHRQGNLWGKSSVRMGDMLRRETSYGIYVQRGGECHYAALWSERGKEVAIRGNTLEVLPEGFKPKGGEKEIRQEKRNGTKKAQGPCSTCYREKVEGISWSGNQFVGVSMGNWGENNHS